MKGSTEERKITTIIGEDMTVNSFSPFDCAVLLTEALVRWSLPLPGEIVTTDVSLSANEGA